MKIVILGPAHPYRGGIAALNERLAVELQKEGHEVKIVTFTLQYPGFLFPGKSQFADGAAPENLVIDRKINSVNPLNWLTVGRQLRREKPDLLIARFWVPFIGPSLGTICRIVRKNRRTKIIALTDNIVPHEKKPGDRLLTAWFLKACQGVVVMSKSVLDDLNTFDRRKPRRFGPHPIYDHYGKITSREEALRKLNLDPAFNYLLFFGLIRDYKGLDLLIEALGQPLLADLKIKLLVAGEFYTDEEKYRDQVKQLSLEERIIFYNQYIPNNEVENYFNAADLVVQPYKTATQSGVTQVAYHFNKPMLVTDVGGLGEIVPHEKAGYVVAPSPAVIAEAIRDFYTNNRKTFFENGVKEEKKRFGWDNFTRLFYELMEEIGK
ncbi:MAG TPA: glycosyltransferase [Prolixibacteraceae bacterium]|nr:glycosyltransferase [Prolixibacteraceae bacterium]